MKAFRSEKPVIAPLNHNKTWTVGEIVRLNAKAASGRSTVQIARDLGRTVAAVKNMASHQNISLKPRD